MPCTTVVSALRCQCEVQDQGKERFTQNFVPFGVGKMYTNPDYELHIEGTKSN